jgi:hypothetical protein
MVAVWLLPCAACVCAVCCLCMYGFSSADDVQTQKMPVRSDGAWNETGESSQKGLRDDGFGIGYTYMKGV